jgi:glycosyltransferase involved in cell wall biosynthesis
VLNLLRVMSRDHRITLFTFTDGHEPAEAMSEIAGLCERIEVVRLPRWRSWVQAWLALFTTVPSQVGYFHSPAMRRRVRDIVGAGGTDVVFTHTIRMTPFTSGLRHPAEVLFLADSQGLLLGRAVEFEAWWKRPGLAWEQWRVNHYTVTHSQRARETLALSPLDRDDLVRIGCPNVVLATHGVDERLFDVQRAPAAEPTVVFLGNLSVPHNIDAAQFLARDIWPLIRREEPRARLVIAGAGPVPAIQRLGDRDGIEVPGLIPDLRPLWSSAHVMVAPLRFSTGIQNKVLEPMAAGVPVVTTPQVAEGIEARHGEHLLVATDAQGLAAATLETLRDAASAAERAERARAHVRERFGWGNIVRRLEQVAAAGR